LLIAGVLVNCVKKKVCKSDEKDYIWGMALIERVFIEVDILDAVLKALKLGVSFIGLWMVFDDEYDMYKSGINKYQQICSLFVNSSVLPCSVDMFVTFVVAQAWARKTAVPGQENSMQTVAKVLLGPTVVLSIPFLPFIITHWIPGVVIYFPYVIAGLVPMVVIFGGLSWLYFVKYQMTVHPMVTFLFAWILKGSLSFIVLVVLQVPMNWTMISYDDSGYIKEHWLDVVKDEFDIRSTICFFAQTVSDSVTGIFTILMTF
jgi:hypothetical protein